MRSNMDFRAWLAVGEQEQTIGRKLQISGCIHCPHEGPKASIIQVAMKKP
jgi:hypothetical protein